MNLAPTLSMISLFLAIAACTPPQTSAPKEQSSTLETQSSTEERVVYCGGETDVATVERYFSDLRRALTESAPPARFNAFVADTFAITDVGGRTLWFKLEDIGVVTPTRISIRDWQEISRRGAQSLNDFGWRGCFMDHGKASFEASPESGFRLTGVRQDEPWAEPTKGNMFY